MNADAKTAVVKFAACGAIVVFTAVSLVAGDHGGVWRTILYTTGGGVCCGLIWPNQDQGDALIDWMKEGRR